MNRRQAKKIIRNRTRRGYAAAYARWRRDLMHADRRWGRWSPHGAEHRARGRRDFGDGTLRLWWLSFCDGNDGHFLGACMVWALGIGAACVTARRLGCNPGGEVRAIACEEGRERFVEQKYIGVLLDKAACERFDHEMLVRMAVAGLKETGEDRRGLLRDVKQDESS